MLIAVSACGNGSPLDSSPVRIAVAAPMTGDNAQDGLGFYQAAILQAEAWNARGGVLGRPVEIVQFDDIGSMEEGAAVAELIAADSTIVGVVGHFSSGVAMAASHIYEENHIVNISPSATNPNFGVNQSFIFRNNTVIRSEASAALDIAVQLGFSRIGVLSVATVWGERTSEIVIELIEQNFAMVLVAHEEIDERTTDFIPAITSLHNMGAEVIICVSMYDILAPFAIQYARFNPNIQIIGFSNAYTDNLIALGGSAVEGVRFPVAFFSGSPHIPVQWFVQEYFERFGEIPSALTAQAFDSTGMILQAIEEAGGTDDRAAIRQALVNITYYGVTGRPPTRFTPDGDVIREFTKVVIQNGAFMLAD